MSDWEHVSDGGGRQHRSGHWVDPLEDEDPGLQAALDLSKGHKPARLKVTSPTLNLEVSSVCTLLHYFICMPDEFAALPLAPEASPLQQG